MKVVLAAFALVAAPVAAQTTPVVASPDGRLTVTMGVNDEKQPTYALSVGGQVVIAPSALGLQLERYAQLSAGLAVTGIDRRSGEDRYTLPAGKVAAVAERYDEAVVHLAEAGPTGRKLDVVFRAYDTGLAFRYRVPGTLPMRIVTEKTEFAFPADYNCHGLNLGSQTTSHEGEFDPLRASTIRAHNMFESPFACTTWRGGPAIAIAEADVTDWSAMYLAGRENGRLGLLAKLSRRADDPTIAVKTIGAGTQSPWRVVMVAPTPGKLIENTMLTSLNPPAQGDFGWVKPGKTAWDWWSGPILSGVPKAGTNNATIKGFVDFAAARKFPYMMIDDGWYVNSGDGGTLNPGADATRTIPAVDMPMLVDYAKQRGVDLIVWVHWKLLDRDMDRLTALYERWGLKGIKVDFMDRDDQEMIDFYHRLAAATAKHHLLLDLHGATHPWGMTRTWPNFITQEGVLGAEYNKWTYRITARHNVNLAYTRLLTGPMDYTPGGFRNRTPETFRPSSTAPQVQSTRGAGLAMYVVFESPLASIADSPDAYRDAAGVDFLEQVPASWDETRFIAGDVGDYVAVARRKGATWFVGAMTNEAGRTVSLPLDFLGKGRFTARSWADGKAPTELVNATRAVAAKDVLKLALAPSGGAVAVIAPVQ